MYIQAAWWYENTNKIIIIKDVCFFPVYTGKNKQTSLFFITVDEFHIEFKWLQKKYVIPAKFGFLNIILIDRFRVLKSRYLWL
jgi:hypothetical protein